jgi:hypothetical protein
MSNQRILTVNASRERPLYELIEYKEVDEGKKEEGKMQKNTTSFYRVKNE